MTNNNLATCAIPAILLLLLSLLSFSSPSVTTMAQPQTPGGATITTTTTPSSPPPLSPPLTPEEQEQQTRLQNVIAATNQNLDEAEKEVNGIVFTPRWSNVVWVEPDSLAVLFAYCLPGEFAESGQEILGGFELEVLESYEVALAQGFMAWMMVVGNEDRQDRLPAAVGVICASDTNDVETRVLSPEEQQQINNIVQQFTTQVTNIEQVVNIINNITTNGTGGTTTPPRPPTGNITENPPTGNGTGGTGGGGPFPPVGPIIPHGNITAVEDTTPPVVTFATYDRLETSNPEGVVMNWITGAEDNVDGRAILESDNYLRQVDDPAIGGNTVGGSITISCNPPSGSIFPIGVTTVQCTAVDEAGNVGTASSTVTVELLLPGGVPQGGITGGAPIGPAEELEGAPPAAPTVPEEEEGAAPLPAEEEQQPPATTTEDEGAATPPADDGGGG